MGHHSGHTLGATLTEKGVEFCVWAPFAKSVAVMVGEPYNWHDTPLESEEDGHWFGFVEGARAGQSYKYKIETPEGEMLERNDPRARQVSVSDDGVSIIVDSTYDWGSVTQPEIPREKQIIYELHIGTFNRPDASTPGTFATAIEKLDYLQSLGITTIELMPVASMAMSAGWGYAPNYLFAVENSYGGRHGLLEFVKAAHQRGLAVILDVVYNHLYPENDLWRFDGWHEGDYGGIYFFNNPRGETPWGGRPDYGRPEVRQYILDNVAMWLGEYRLDGLRVDSTIYMRNTRGPEGDESTSIPEAWTLMQEMTSLAKRINPNSLIVAEDSSVSPEITQPVSQGGAGFDAQWGLSFPHTVRAFLGIEADEYGNTLASEIPHSYNGDVYQKVIFSDSHDTAANGAVRLNEAAAPGSATNVVARANALVANALTLTAPGIPLLLQGGEFMQEGDFNDWHMLEWSRADQFTGIVNAHQHIINLRLNRYGNTAGMTADNFEVFHFDAKNQVIAFRRWDKGGPNDETIIIANGGNERFENYELTIPTPGTWHVRFNSSWHGYSPEFHETTVSEITPDKDGRATLPLSDNNILILSQNS